MAGKVFFSVSMSLDGFIAPEPVPFEDFLAPEKKDHPQVRRWMAQWIELQQWVFPQRFFRENLKFGEGGEEGEERGEQERRAEAGGHGRPVHGMTRGGRDGGPA